MNLFANVSPDHNEEWRDVLGFEGLYQVSNLGRVKRLARKDRLGRTKPAKLLTPTGTRYKSVSFTVDGQWYNKLVHRLVATAFVPNPDNLREINHLDGDITNNRADNLEWCTPSANHNDMVAKRTNYSYRIKVKCLETGEIFPSISAAGRSVSADATQIVESIQSSSCCKGKTFVYVNAIPEDVEAYLEEAHAKYQKFHRRPQMKNCKKLRCIETGEEFDSIAEAGRRFKCDTATIKNRIEGNRTVDGVTLEFI